MTAHYAEMIEKAGALIEKVRAEGCWYAIQLNGPMDAAKYARANAIVGRFNSHIAYDPIEECWAIFLNEH